MKINRQNLLYALCIALAVIAFQHRQDIVEKGKALVNKPSSEATTKVKAEVETVQAKARLKESVSSVDKSQIKEKKIPKPTKVAQKTHRKTDVEKPEVKQIPSKAVVEKPQVKKITTKAVIEKPKPKEQAPKPKAQASKPVAVKRKSAEITFKQAVYSFGEITEGDIIKHQFKFTNTGDKELEVLSAYASCGCTDPSYPFLGIPPGEEGVIGVTYNSVSKEGPQQVEVTITTNADKEAFKLFLTGTVKPKAKKDSIKVDSSQLTKEPKYPVKKS